MHLQLHEYAYGDFPEAGVYRFVRFGVFDGSRRQDRT
ncbi:hypothetical protein J2S53_000571 [Actinopolyspora lacussalsi]|nr:hypothetical protein [Actinopolyspora lacussalsi]